MAREIILHPSEAKGTIPVVPFKLDSVCRRSPSHFEFEIKVGHRYFAYGFAATSEKIREEWLFEIGLETERKVFERSGPKIEVGKLPFENDIEKQFLTFTARGTLPNRLFLTECRERDIRKNVPGGRDIADVLSWFEDVPSFVFPGSSADLVYGIRTNHEFRIALDSVSSASTRASKGSTWSRWSLRT